MADLTTFLFGANTQTGIAYKLEDVIEGMRVAASGQTLPANIDEKKLLEKIDELQYELFEQKCLKNIQSAENCLSKIAQKPNIKVLIPDKLYYEVLHEGSGQAIAPTSTALFQYKITTLDETVVADTCEDGPKSISLANAIPGFAKGVEGMKYREKRKLYIHPDLAYRKIGIVVPPQTLLIIEVEAIP